MKYYIDTDNKPYVFEDNVTPEIIAKVESTHNTVLTEITEADYKSIIAPKFSDLQAAKISELTDSYLAEAQSDIDYMGTTFQADEKSQNMISKVLVASGGTLPADFYWVDANNVKIPMTYDDLQGLSNAILVRGQQLFDKLQTLKEQVTNATSVDEVNSIVW